MPAKHLIFERQSIHISALAALLTGMYLAGKLDGMHSGAFWGIGTSEWFRLAIAFPIAHQVYIWFCWRVQLHGKMLDKIFGNLSFPVYATGFFTLGALRLLSFFALAISNRNTLPGDITIPRIFAVVILIPALYLLYSVLRYFGLLRACGIDHFDEKYRTMPFVRKGIFRFTRNSMYIYGFLFFWSAALWCASIAALCVALFNQLYIWVHYYTTELPDMKRIYGETRLNS